MKNLHLTAILRLALLAVALTSVALAEEKYYALFMDNRKVGHAVLDRKIQTDNVISTEKVTMTVGRGLISVTVSTTAVCSETKDGRPLAFEFVENLSGLSSKTSGKLLSDGTLELTEYSLGSEYKSVKPWPKDALLSEGLRLLQMKKGLKPGLQYTCTAFSPQSADTLEMHVTVGPKKDIDILGRSLSLSELLIEMKMAGASITTTEYLDDDFELYKSTMPVAGMTIVMLACDKDLALAPNDYYEMVDRMFIPSPQPIPNARSTKAIAYRIRPIGGAKISIPASDIQLVSPDPNGDLMVGVRMLALPQGVTFPYKGTDKEILAALQPTKYLQSDNEQIKALAKRAVGDAKDAALAVKRIESFVAEYVTNKSLSVGYASAAEVAQTRQGDCTEFAVLAASMCRAVGIPAQTVMGFAYIDEFAHVQSSFGGHAWARAYLDGKWYDFDPAFLSAQLGGFNPAHIALAYSNGDPADFFQLATTLGNFSITELRITPAMQSMHIAP